MHQEVHCNQSAKKCIMDRMSISAGVSTKHCALQKILHFRSASLKWLVLHGRKVVNKCVVRKYYITEKLRKC